MIAYAIIVITLCLICMIHICPLSQSIIVSMFYPLLIKLVLVYYVLCLSTWFVAL